MTLHNYLSVTLVDYCLTPDIDEIYSSQFLTGTDNYLSELVTRDHMINISIEDLCKLLNFIFHITIWFRSLHKSLVIYIIIIIGPFRLWFCLVDYNSFVFHPINFISCCTVRQFTIILIIDWIIDLKICGDISYYLEIFPCDNLNNVGLKLWGILVISQKYLQKSTKSILKIFKKILDGFCLHHSNSKTTDFDIRFKKLFRNI